MWIRDLRERKTLRRDVRVPCQVVTDADFQLLGEETLDLSPHGMLLRSHEAAKPGDSVIVSLRLPHSKTWIDAEGEIARIVRGYRATDTDRAIGIGFTQIGAIESAMLGAALEQLPPPVPARQVRKDYAAAIKAVAFNMPRTFTFPAEAYLGA